ncbi:hypothetical protein AB0B28_04850 [Glycomyces sp. NPDC046736]|uniref:hypothetical protein n=1 Tax=Glycomyces sp. NPDC046736 TaxID=3155615 RepID=UPI0033F87DE2
MNFHQEWAGEDDLLSEFDLAGSAEPARDEDPETPVADPEGAVPDEADPQDAAEQRIEVPLDEEDEPEGA